jgi:predicted RNase H-like nuclease
MTPTGLELQPYDVEGAERELVAQGHKASAEALVIVDDATDAEAKTVLAIITKDLKEAEDLRVATKAPHLKVCQDIDAAFKEAVTTFKAAKDIIAKKTGAYFADKKKAEDEKILAREREMREAATARAKAEAEAAAAGAPRAPEAVVAPPAAVPATQSVTRTEAGDVGMAKLRGFRVVYEDQIPREFWTLDTAAIGKVYRSGGDVPGCVEDITYVPRTR